MITRQKTLLRVAFWVISVSTILVIGVVHFPQEDPTLNIWSSLYYTVSLFVFAQYLSEFPKAWPLILIYFAAPALSLSAVGTALRYMFRHRPAIRTRWLNNHVVICGVGRTGKLLAAALKEKGYEVVGVDTGPVERFEEWVAETKIPMIYGDFMSRVVLSRAGAQRARSLFFASGDDLLNLEGVVGAYEWFHTDTSADSGISMSRTGEAATVSKTASSVRAPSGALWAHVANENLARTVKGTFSKDADIRIFDTYHIAAEEMVHRHFPRDRRGNIAQIFLLGFGKFGRDLFEVLALDLLKYGETPEFRIFDVRDLERDVRLLAGELGFSGQITFDRSDINTLMLENAQEKAFFLCTDDDIGNLSAALMLARRMANANIFVRMAKWPMPAIDRALHEKSGINFININELVEDNLIELVESDTFRSAAQELVLRHFTAVKRQGIDEIILSGFGRFGHDLFALMADDLTRHGQSPRMRIIDIRDYSSEVRELAEKLGWQDRIRFEQTHTQSLSTLDSPAQAVFLCCDDDEANLSTATALRKSSKSRQIYFRMANWPDKQLYERVVRETGAERPGVERLVGTKVINLLEMS